MKTITSHLLPAAAACIMLVSCTEIEQEASIPGPAIQGLAIPIRLNPDTTLIRLSEFVSDPKLIRSVKIDGKELSWNANGELWLTQPQGEPVVNLELDYDKIRYDIPVFASEKVKHRFVYNASSNKVNEVSMSGTMNGWNHKATSLVHQADRAWEVSLTLNPGLYQYRIWEDGKEMLDANNAEVIVNGMGGLNNTFVAGETPSTPPFLFAESENNGQLIVRSLHPFKGVLAYFENHLIPLRVKGDQVVVNIPGEARTVERSHIRIFSHDGKQRGNDVLIPLEYGKPVRSATQLRRDDLHGTIMYFMMVDRFADGNPLNNRPTPDKSILPQANNLGGDIAGITAKIREGYFSELGINTIWISPISRNAEGAWGLWDKGIRSTFSAYHGYWPTALRAVDDRFGTDEDLRELIDVAHANGMNVILDYVAHHVHQDHPLYKEKPDWTTPLYLPDGTMNTEKWDEHRLTTWFDTFLPTWDFSKPEVVDALSDTAIYWVTQFDLDGFRHDATKHIPEDFWRSLTGKIKTASQPGRRIFQIGETYGSPELISSYISSGQMDAQFDFNLYDAAVDAFAKPETDFRNLQRVMEESMRYYGSHHLMGNITGNQDRARFISYADGSVRFDEDAKLAGWTRKIENRGADGFARAKMLMAFLLTTPGIPCVYYGDEIGMPGGNDPDNRRMMKFAGWNREQESLHSFTSTMASFRRSSLPLSYGETQVLKNDDEGFVFVRHYFEETVMSAFSKRSGVLEIDLPSWIGLQGLPRSVTGQQVSLEGRRMQIQFDAAGAAVVQMN